MAKRGYKIVLSNKNIFKEIELGTDMTQLRVGTSVECDFRLYRELFFGTIDLLFVKKNDEWSVICSDNLYLSVGDARKMMTKNMAHGDSLEVKYQESDNSVFKLDFLIDFDDGKLRYDRRIDVIGSTKLTIGNMEDCNIFISSDYVKDDKIVLTRCSEDFEINIFNARYGVYINGRKVESGTKLKNGDFLSMSDFFFYYKDGMLSTEKKEGLSVKGLTYIDEKISSDYPKFNRSTRIKTVVCDDKIEILDPPAKPQKPKNNIFVRLLPSFGMLIASGVMAYFGGMMIIMSAISGLMAIFTTIMSVGEASKDYKQETKERIEKYNLYIERKKKEIENNRRQELMELNEVYISEAVEKDRLDVFSPELFDRDSGDEDFLCVRLGNGKLISKREINYKKQEKLEIDDELQQMPEEICKEFKYLQNAPIICNFKECNAIGIVGDINQRFVFLKNIVFDIAVRHFFSDVKLLFVAEYNNKDKVLWLRYLPHVYNDTLGIRNIVTDDESKNIIFEYLYKELTEREQNKSFTEHLVIFLFDERGFKNHPTSKFVKDAKQLGVTFVFFGNATADVPQGCDNIIRIVSSSNAELIDANDKANTSMFTYTEVSDEIVENMVKLLAPVYTEEISLEGTLTKNITLFELLNIIAVDDINLKERWTQSQVFKSMSAPLGVSRTGVVGLDLHDKAHGPHGLVAGTTGSGKSEILQTYILSMATLYHPYEVAFVIIDFKGGGMVNQFKDLPHLLGAITNIDGKEINRSLKSIKAELQKRQRLFADAEVNHIDKYIKKYKSGETKIPLPHLIIIVDEFAELKAEQPEFMKELISAARIGRSLGVHLILATQKPSGQVSEQIWSNSRFKLCLKVQDQQDSNEVLKSPLAAEIKEPGRAYLQVGNNEIFELFQSAYSGAPEKMDDSNIKEFTIFSLSENGKKIPIYEQKKKKASDGSLSQLDAIVNYVADYCKKINLDKLSDICLPSLSACIDFEQNQSVSKEGYSVEIGLYDDPDNQYQGTYSIDLLSNNLIIIGSSQMGKTNILQDIIRGLSSWYSPNEVSIYIIDFASMVLKNFDKLNHVGGVVCPSEDEKLKNLFKLLHTEIEERKEKLMQVGISSFSAYRDAGETDLPLIILMIDNLTALKELYFHEDDELLGLCREGLTVGISIVIANSQTAGIGYKYLSNFSSRIALFCNDSNEYGSLFEQHGERLDNIPGRCIIELDKKHYECQSYLAFTGEKEIERVQEIKKYINATNANYKNMLAKRIPLIPATLTKGFIVEQFSCYMEEKYSIVAGLDYATVNPFAIDFSSIGLLAIAGREEFGKYGWLKYSVDMLETMYPINSKLYVVDSIGKKLALLKQCDSVEDYTMVAEDAVSYIKEIEDKLKVRYDALVAGNEEVLNKAELLLLVIDNQDALQAICNNSESLNAYKNIIGRYKNMKVCIISFIENANIAYSAPEILKNIRDQRNIMFFDDLINMKLFDVPLAMARNFKKPIELGDGYYIHENECIKLKTAIRK